MLFVSASTNAFMSFISGNKQPRLVVKLSVPKKEQKEMLEYVVLVCVIVCCLKVGIIAPEAKAFLE